MRNTTFRYFPSALGLLVLLLAGVMLLSACKSQRRFGERKPIGKAYHNFTARYNGYFNANELVVLAEEELASARKIDYGEVLPIYPAYSIGDATAVSGNLDKAMEKVSLVVNIHRPSSYDDDSYLLLGRAQLLKKDFESAEHTLEFAVKDFDPANETARLRRIQKKKIADAKARDKEARSRVRSASGGPPPRQRPPKSAPKRRKTAPQKRKKTKKKKRPSSDKPKSKSSSSSSSRKKKSSSRSKKPKTRAEMAREQREAKLAAEKEKARDAAKAEREAEEAAAKKAAAEAAKQEALTAGKALDADAALEDGKGLEKAVAGEASREMPFVHEPAMQDINYWLARTYIAREKYIDAERILGKLSRSASTFKRIRRQLPAAYAELYLARQRPKDAIPYLEDAIALTKKRADRARYSFILAQLLERQGNSQGAYAAYKKVLKLKPDFEMVFNAELNLAGSAYAAGSSDREATIKELNRMSKEEKYAEYRDQIFFKMAEISLSAGDKVAGIEFLQKGLAQTSGNPIYAAKAYLQLGDIYFAEEAYVLASNYYDSTLQVLPKENPRYTEVETYSRNLKPIAANLMVIALQDSLLAVAQLPKDEQFKLAARLEQERRDAERQKAIAASKAAATTPTSSRTRRGAPSQATSNFFAYDEKSRRRALKAFERKWGERPLDDNWRTIDEREATVAKEEEISTEVAEATVTDEEVAEILKAVPNDEQSRENAHAAIQDAFIALGRQYRDKLENPRKAAEALEELLRRYPETEYAAEALYLMALAYDEIGEQAKARAAREQLKKDYPTSKYAKSLLDPNFIADQQNAEKKLVAFYDATYQLFEQNEIKQVLDRIQSVPAEFGEENKLQPRFALLRALAIGKAEGKDPYVKALREVVADHPKAEEATRAKEILRLLGERAGAVASLDQAGKQLGQEVNTDIFKLTPDKSHYFLAIVPKGESMSKAKAAVADYNTEYHRLEKLAIGNVYMMASGEQTPVIVIRRFKTQADAMNYYAEVTSKTDEFMGGTEFVPLVISQTNYREVLRAKAFAEYQVFFQENYL